MAKLVAVCRTDDYQFERRQIPLVVDDSLIMVVQFNEKCINCEHVCGIKQKDLERFVQKFSALSKDELAIAMMVTSKDILSLLSQLIPCVGCRRSVERLFSQLVTSRHPALEPLVITPKGILSVNRNYLFDPKALYALFYIHGCRLNEVMDSIPKSKKNKRCNLHSLELHKTRTTSSWIDVWELMSQDCRDEVLLVDAEALLDTLENYLRKHRFCSECKSKVLRAYSILVGEVDSSKEKGYCPSLYEGLRCCPQEHHIHLLCETDFIAQLIIRAEPELAGATRRDRHAKTLDIAQEEVLTCLGFHVCERLHRISQKLRAEEQTWQILFYLGVDALKKSFEMAVERKQGISNLELMCEELLEEERAKEQRREQKRQKKKKKKAKSQTEKENEASSCQCDTNSNSNAKTPPTDRKCSCEDLNSNIKLTSLQSCRNCVDNKHSGLILGCRNCDGNQLKDRGHYPHGCGDRNCDYRGSGRGSDCGYSSGPDGCDTCSMPSSNDGSDITCSDGVSAHEEIDCKQRRYRDSISKEQMYGCLSCRPCSVSQKSSKYQKSPKHNGGTPPAAMTPALSLQDMLESEEYGSSADPCVIAEEDIRMFKDNKKQLLRKRQELRVQLKQRFQTMQQKSCCTETCPSSLHQHPSIDRITRDLFKL